MSANTSENEIKSWLKTVLAKDNLSDLSVHILGNSEKGDGYLGDIVFVHARGTTKGQVMKQYELVLKCSKRSQALRKTTPVQKTFYNEIYVYQQLLPSFAQFQREKGLEDYFDFIPKCYGTITSTDMEILVFENLKKAGYSLWPKKQPMTICHVKMVLEAYARYHATSVATKIYQPKKFQEFVDNLGNIFREFNETTDLVKLFGGPIEEVSDLIKDELDEKVVQKWIHLKEEVAYIFGDLIENVDGLKVILHGDCWNNNFMFKYNHNDLPSKVAILDWQLARYSSPILDLSYFIFACISKEDLQELDVILKIYYDCFVKNLSKLGCSSGTVYSYEQFTREWKKYSKFGVMMTSLIMKICSTEKDQAIDIAERAEEGVDFADSFKYDVKDKENIKKRMVPIVRYAVEHALI